MGCEGLKFKLFWRILPNHDGWHLFRAVSKGERRGGRFVSCCGLLRIQKVYGQDVNRPRSVLRCQMCDLEEIRIRQVDEGLDERITHPERPLHSMTIQSG